MSRCGRGFRGPWRDGRHLAGRGGASVGRRSSLPVAVQSGASIRSPSRTRTSPRHSVSVEADLAAADRSGDRSGWNVGKTVAEYAVETAVCIVRRDVKLNHGCSVDREGSLDKGLLH
jgi:hypothetical protein